VVLVSLDQSLGHFHAVAAKAGLRQGGNPYLRIFLCSGICCCSYTSCFKILCPLSGRKKILPFDCAVFDVPVEVFSFTSGGGGLLFDYQIYHTLYLLGCNRFVPDIIIRDRYHRLFIP
jgi:hypothetical protein